MPIPAFRTILLGGLAALGLTASACVIHTSSSTQTLRDRGAHDLRCAPDQLHVENIGGASYEVQGCGASRVYTCNSAGTACIPEAPRRASARPGHDASSPATASAIGWPVAAS